jgi:hypothetical protein
MPFFSESVEGQLVIQAPRGLKVYTRGQVAERRDNPSSPKTVDRFKFLDVMLGDQPPLTPPELAYQRMLAGDSDEAAEQAELFLQQGSLLSYNETVLVEALKLAQEDAERGLLDNDRMSRVRDTVIEIVDDLSGHEDKADMMEATVDDTEERGPLAHIASAEESLARDGREIPLSWRNGKPVLCIPGAGIPDEAFTAIVAQEVARHGIGVRIESRDALSISRVFTLDTTDVELLCVCYLASVTTAHSEAQGRRREAGSEGSVKQSGGPMDKNRI